MSATPMEEAIAELRQLVRAQQERISAQDEKLASLQAQLDTANGQAAPDRTPKQVSRGGLLKAAAAGAAGLAGAGVIGALGAEPASANTGDNLLLGNANAADHVTEVHWNGAGSYGGVIFLANDSSSSGTGATFPAALGGWTSGKTAGVASGVYGFTNVASNHAYGVVGWSNSGVGFGAGVFGLGDSNGGTGVIGIANSDSSLVPLAGLGYGVYGATSSTATGAVAVYGGLLTKSASNNSSAVWGENQGTGGGYGVYGSHAGAGMGVYGFSQSGWGVAGFSSTGYGGVFSSGGLAPLWLQPALSAGAPTSGSHNKGEIYADSAGVLWTCIVSGTPGTWKSLSSVVPIPNVRVLNTRPGKQIGPYTGPISSNTVLSLTLAGTNGIPASATGVMGNLTAADATGPCFLALVPHGANHLGVSSVNFETQVVGHGIANAFTVGLSSDGKVDIYTGNCGSYTVNIIMDITGYFI